MSQSRPFPEGNDDEHLSRHPSRAIGTKRKRSSLDKKNRAKLRKNRLHMCSNFLPLSLLRRQEHENGLEAARLLEAGSLPPAPGSSYRSEGSHELACSSGSSSSPATPAIAKCWTW